MLNVGLTGNIASGKTAVASRLAVLGAVVLDADTYAREAVTPGTHAFSEVIARFGPRVLSPSGLLDRAALGRVVFSDAAARKDLERIIHPEVARRREGATAAARGRGATIVIADVPLLFEAGLAGEFDAIILVDADDSIRLDRLVRERGMTEPDARTVMAAQGDAAAKRPLATYVVENNRSVDALQRRVDEVWRDLQLRAGLRP